MDTSIQKTTPILSLCILEPKFAVSEVTWSANNGVRPFLILHFLKSSLNVLWVKPSTHKKAPLAFSAVCHILSDLKRLTRKHSEKGLEVVVYFQLALPIAASRGSCLGTVLLLLALTGSTFLWLSRTHDYTFSTSVFSTTPLWNVPYNFRFYPSRLFILLPEKQDSVRQPWN